MMVMLSRDPSRMATEAICEGEYPSEQALAMVRSSRASESPSEKRAMWKCSSGSA